MSTDTNVNNLIINTLTKTQFTGITSPSSNELYFVEDEQDTSNYYTKEEVLELIADLKSEITSLTTRVEALENK